MKRWISVVLIGILAISATGCSTAQGAEESPARSVSVTDVKSVERADVKTYIGTIDAKDIVKYSFKTPGKIAAIPVEVGQPVRKGD